MELENELTFTLGDPFTNGHGHESSYTIESNYSSLDITHAYVKATKKLGFDFVKEVCRDYDDHDIHSNELEKLREYGIKIEDCVDIDILKSDLDGKEYAILYGNTDAYVRIFFDIIKKELPNFKYNFVYRNRLCILDGAAYGLFYD